MEFNNQFQKISNQNLQPSKWPILPNWLVIIFLVIWYPIGLIIMWLFTKWSKKAKIFVTVTPFLIIVLLAFVVFFSLRQAREKAMDRSNAINSQSTQQIERKLNETVVLKTYGNEKYGFEFKYPSELCINEENLDPIYEGEDKDHAIYIESCPSPQQPITRKITSIAIMPNAIKNSLSQNASLEGYVNKLAENFYINSKTMTYSKEKVSLNNNLFAYKIYRTPKEGKLNIKEITWFFTKTGTNLLFVVSAIDGASNNNSAITSNILSTFRFIK